MAQRGELAQQETYQIRVRGHLDQRWSDWFDGFDIVPQPNDETLLTGPVVDQPALHGLLNKIRDLGLPLLSVQRVDDAAQQQVGEHGAS